MLLDVGERLVLLSILPKEESFVTMKIIRKLKMGLGFDDEELKRFNFVQKPDNTVSWENGTQTKEVEIGEKAKDIIAGALKELDKAKKLRDEHMSIYEKFVEA